MYENIFIEICLKLNNKFMYSILLDLVLGL